MKKDHIHLKLMKDLPVDKSKEKWKDMSMIIEHMNLKIEIKLMPPKEISEIRKI